MKKTSNKIALLVGILSILLLFVGLLMNKAGQMVQDALMVPFTEFQDKVDDRNVSEVYIDFNSDTFYFLDKEENKYYTDNPRYDDFKKDLLSAGVKVYEVAEKNETSLFSTLFALLIYFGPVIILLYFAKKMMRKSLVQGEDPNPIEVPIDKLKTLPSSKVTFNDVAGLSELKEDLSTVIDFMKNPKTYIDAGAKLPKGVLLYGPAGTGKTLIAKAIAGEADVNFISAVGSDFSSKFVGEAAQRVRELFAAARKIAPCVVFIDEIDAVGCSRDEATMHNENRNTLNALLAEMDGFKGSEGILVIGATNRYDDLDKALVRPGRFDNVFAVPLPMTNDERMEIVNLYAKNKKFDDTVDFNMFAKQMIGNSPAEIESVLNEASIIAAKRNHGIISTVDLDTAYTKKILKGHVKNNKDRDKKQLELTAWHESGHALIGAMFGQEVSKVTILPTSSGAGGFTIFSPDKLGMYSKEELEGQIKSLYAGRAAEELLVGKEKITTGASADIQRATELIYGMVCLYGMCEDGPALLDYSKIKGSDELTINKMNELSRKLYNETVQILEANSDKLERMANLLLDKETITGNDVDAILNG